MTCWPRVPRAACTPRVERLMREPALRARPRRRGLPPHRGDPTTKASRGADRGGCHRAGPAVRGDGAEPDVGRRLHLSMDGGRLALRGGVIDLSSRRVVGWSMSATMAARLVADALTMAIWRRGKPDALLHHSDQGSHYSSEQVQARLADHGVSCSMSRSGTVWDNAAMQSVFASLNGVPHQTGQGAGCDWLRMNSRGERIRKPVWGWVSLLSSIQPGSWASTVRASGRGWILA